MCYRLLVVLYCLIFIVPPIKAQQPADSLLQNTLVDSLSHQLSIDTAGQDPFFGMDSTSGKIAQSLEQLTTDLNMVNGVLKRGLDTVEIHDELPEVTRLLESIKLNIFGPDISPSLRGLNAAKVLLIQNAARLNGWQKTLEKYNSNLQDLRKEILEGLKVGEFRDTTVLLLYKAELVELGKKWQAVRLEFDSQNENIGLLLQRVTRVALINTDLLDEVNFRIRTIKRKMLYKTDSYLWERMPPQQVGFITLLSRSTRLGWRMFVFYVSDHWNYILLLILIAVIFYLLVSKGLREVEKKQQAILLDPVKYLARNTAFCAAILAFTIIPFLSFSPPAIYIELSWFVMLVVATRLAWPDWSAEYRKYWWGVVALFFLFGFDNIIIRITAVERWSVLLLTGFAVYLGWKLIREVRKEPGRYPVFQNEVIWLFIVANGTAFLLNIFGRFTLAKVICNSAVIGLAHALSFFLLVEILIEALYLVLEGNDKNKLAAYFKFSEIKISIRKILVFTGIVLWLMAFFWSLNVMDSVVETIQDFLQKERMIGTMEFTLGSIVVFVVVFWCSFAVSNVLRFFFGGNADNQINSARKSKIGSRILLVRLLVISVGFLLAMGAAGIPLDKLAIIIGALGVGIGFGLQNIVNNLVSGIILAFEKPMDVGDVIEIGPDTGRVKEIGIRSSKISTFDGADIIVPNGDFISQRLTNWTHNNTYRRIELVVGVAYGTDLDKAQKVVQQVLDGDNEIENQPAPSIIWNEMGSSAINMRVLFWTSDFDNWVSLKSKILKAIYLEFNKAGISIPFQQQDLHLKSIDPELIRQFIPPGQQK
ncbi:mechanosensitive ion channel family protein [Flavihumibacter fluvii]|uniref:mechanosensitive ion channel family protein n=1 Tax=Flavihumibacter fluvii TaxID=2838157 RepID=UPI001BDF0104|nr:mechanosensitive ion channel domain-containing protein [Flavihumibacter fluvii]ULQ53797.1 mechanosensitive ion channel [Flavihumibacter fluvii]